MTWSTVPDLTSRRSLLLIALMVTIACVLAVGATSLDAFRHGVGDTDDAVRLVLVRELLAGHGWYHPEIARLQAPWGALMHWSRLLDGGIAALDLIFRTVMSPPQAELATRAVWPLLWLFPGVVATLAIARRLGGSIALLATAIFVCTSIAALEQFHLGRVDHHNVQIVMVLIAAAAAIAGRERREAGLVAGLASAFGLAVGYEGLVFHALIGAFFALSLLRDEAAAGGAARRYGLALGLGGLAFFLIQTPPRLWTTSVCDTIGANLVACLLVAGLGVAGASYVGRTKVVRLAVLTVTGAAALGVYLAMNPNCLHGPMGDVRPPVSDYINLISEMMPFWQTWLIRGPLSIAMISGPVLALAASPFLLARQGRWKESAWLLLMALLGSGMALTLLHIRMHSYANWLALPVIGCALAELAPFWRKLLTPTVLVAILVCPTGVALAAAALATPFAPRAPKALDSPLADPCYQTSTYAGFAQQRPGLVLSEINLGPYVVAYTPHAAVAGPYHRFRRGIVDTLRVFSESPDMAENSVRSLHVDYVLDCPRHAIQFDHVQAGARGLLAALDRNRAPAWLEPLSRPTDALQVYKVRPATETSRAK